MHHAVQAKIVLNMLVCAFSEYATEPFSIEAVNVQNGDVTTSYPV